LIKLHNAKLVENCTNTQMVTEAEVWLIGIVLVATIASILFAILSNRSTKKSNELLENQLYITTRPWVSISELHPYKIKSKEQTMDYFKFKELSKEEQKDFHPLEVSFLCHFENIGSLSVNITYSSNMGVGELIKENIKKLEIKEKSQILLPKQKVQRLIPVSYSLLDNIEKEPIFVVTQINYQFEHKKNKLEKGSIHRIWKITTQGIIPMEYW